MNEFLIIDRFFKSSGKKRSDVRLGVGDDAACMHINQGQELVVTTDTMVYGRHFSMDYEPQAIANKLVRINVSDIAAMAAEPCWALLSLTLPDAGDAWLSLFSQGLDEALKKYNISLVGGDITKGPLTLTLTLLGTVPEGKAVKRSGAKSGDIIYVTGDLGAAALALHLAGDNRVDPEHQKQLKQYLNSPQPGMDFIHCLQNYANSAIDISDGLSADLQHICDASHLGACLMVEKLPIHPLINRYCKDKAVDLALTGGDDYQICFTVSPENQAAMEKYLKKESLKVYEIGAMEEQPGLRVKPADGPVVTYKAQGYTHF